VDASEVDLAGLGATRLVRGANTVGLLIGLWVIVWPQPYGLAMGLAALAPWAALALSGMSGGRVLFFAPRDMWRKPSLFLLAASGVTVMRVFWDLHVVDWSRLLAIALGLAVIFSACGYVVVRHLAGYVADLVIVMATGSVAYALGGVAALNSMTDLTPPRYEAATIANLRTSHGRSSDSYYLDLSHAGETDEVAVDGRFYRGLTVGDTVCFARHRGRLGIAWFTVTTCPKGVVLSPA
jgi:hypothetical protein